MPSERKHGHGQVRTTLRLRRYAERKQLILNRNGGGKSATTRGPGGAANGRAAKSGNKGAKCGHSLSGICGDRCA